MQDLMTMNIRAPHGTAVMAVHKYGQVWNGAESDKELIRKHIDLNKVYHVDRTVVGDWSSTVYLIEVPDTAFNTVNFEEI